MNVYVLGAGISKKLGYPLGRELLPEVDKFIKEYPREFNHFDHSEWPIVLQRLAENENILVREAFKFGHFEHLLTVLDHYDLLANDFILENLKSRNADQSLSSVRKEFEEHQDHLRQISKDREILLYALTEFLEYRHQKDLGSFNSEFWTDLNTFSEKLQKGDVIVTFNYDSCVERVLLNDGKWSPTNGYGFKIELIGEPLVDREIVVLHLHGATGWYEAPIFESGREISLDPSFLQNLGLDYFDTTMTEPNNEARIIIHPTYIKSYEVARKGDQALIRLWRLAADALRAASKIAIIGYSMPLADSAARTLLITNCEPERVEIVNTNLSTVQRLSEILVRKTVARPVTLSFQQWLGSFGTNT